MKHARSRSAHAKLARYLLFVSRTGPCLPNMTTRAAVLPTKAKAKIIVEMLIVIHSASIFPE
jgi:hypothetical protein